VSHALATSDPADEAAPGAGRGQREQPADRASAGLPARVGPAYDLGQSVARTERPPVRIVDRATQAYRLGKLGLPPLARLLGQ